MACPFPRAGLLVAALLLAAARPAFAGPPCPAPPSAAKADRGGSATAAPTLKLPGAKKPRVLVTISKDTTVITEPLRPDGYPDYVAALNQRFSKGVTPENNSAVLFWKALGPKAIDEKHRDQYFKMLGIPRVPEEGDYFITSEEWVKRQKAKEERKSDQPEESYEDPIWEQQMQIMKRPWSKEEFPVWADWLVANEKPLTLMVEASKRPRRYDPMLGDSVIAILLPAAQQYRDVVRALAARAMLRAHEGRIDEAWQDLLACHRFARLVGQGATLIDVLVAVTIDGIACSGDCALLQHAKPTVPQLVKMRADLAKLSPIPKMADKLDVCERFMLLDCTCMVARDGPSALSEVTGGGKSDSMVWPLTNAISSVIVDWDVPLRMANSWYDRFQNAWRKPTWPQRRKALDVIDADIKTMADSARDVAALGLSVLGNPRKAVSDWVGRVLSSLLLPALSACANAETRSVMNFELTDLAFALAQYREEHGSYPAKLADLKPKYVATVPKDLFTDAELHYRRDGAGYLLYSVGPNGIDDGGEGPGVREEGEKERDDIAVHMPAR
jgi:hypothetical protein